VSCNKFPFFYPFFLSSFCYLSIFDTQSSSLPCAHLAWRSGRGYVFHEYKWEKRHYPWKIIPQPRTPLSALISGPIVGGPWEENDRTPRSISERWFDTICPPQDTKTINASTAKDPVRGKDAKELANYWVNLLKNTSDRRVNVVDDKKDDYPQTFDLW